LSHIIGILCIILANGQVAHHTTSWSFSHYVGHPV